MKLNWGQSIFIVIIGLISLLLFGIFKILFSENTDHQLVSNSYYEEELDFQKNREKIKRGDTISKYIFITSKENNVLEIITDNNIKISDGEIYFYCPFNSKNDFKVKFILDGENKQIIKSEKFVKGEWVLKLKFKDENNLDYILDRKIKL